jgi:2-alkyl-3-oxoalkanoate reductase
LDPEAAKLTKATSAKHAKGVRRSAPFRVQCEPKSEKTKMNQSLIPNTQYPVLLTGAAGFIAGHLAERLLADGVPVHGTARRPETAAWLAGQGAAVIAADLLDPASLARAATGCRAVVHAAAWTGGAELSPALAWRTNVEGTANVLAAAQAAGVERFIYISSVAVYGVNRAPLIDESMPTPPVGQAYPDSKIAAEALVRASGLPYVIIRPASTYGPRGTAWTVGPIEQIKRGTLVLLGRDTGLVTPGYIDNVIDGLLLGLAHPAALGGTFNLCDDCAVTYREFYLAYARMLGRDRLPTVPGWFALLARSAPANGARRILGRPSVGPWSLHFRRNPSQFSVEKAMRVLGYAPRVDFAQGMRRTEAWLRREGYLRR